MLNRVNAKEEGPAVCGGMLGLRLDRIEPAVLSGISRQLMTPEAVARFRKAFTGKLASMERELAADREIVATALREVNREIKRIKTLLMALADNRLESPELLGSLVEAEARRKTLESQRDAITRDLPSIPENLAEIYRAKVAELVRTLSEPEVVHRASEMLAEIITRIEVRWDQTAKAHGLEIFGDLVGLLGFSDPAKEEAYEGHQSSLKLVAGA